MTQRCSHKDCRKKLKLTDLECKCGNRFCTEHRLQQEHQCPNLAIEKKNHQEYLKHTLIDSKFKKVELI